MRWIGAIFLLALAAAIGLGDSANSTVPSSPEDVFTARGLTHMGFWLILPDEADVHAKIDSLRAAKFQARAENAAHLNSTSDLKSDEDSLEAEEQQFNQLNDQVNRSAAYGKTLSKKDPDKYNSWVDEYNMLLGKRAALAIDIQTKITRLNELQKPSAASSARSNYIGLAMELSAKAETIAAGYKTLARDAELLAAIRQFNQSNGTHARLGPSGLFADDLEFIRQCARDVVSSPVPVTLDDGGDPCVQAVLNGKVTDTMIWDSGATNVILSAATGKALGLDLGDARTVKMAVADGRIVSAKVVNLDSIQLGAFIVKNVECFVQPPEVKAVDLLGDTFQNHFISRLDQQSGQLQLTQIDPNVTQGPLVAAPPLAPPPAPGPANDPPDASSASNGTLDLMCHADKMVIFVNGTKVYEQAAGVLANAITKIPLLLHSGDCLVLRAHGPYAYRDIRFVFVGIDGSARFASDPQLMKVETVDNFDSPVPTQVFASGNAGTCKGTPKQDQTWLDANLSADAKWIHLPGKTANYDFAFAVP
jgi:clan AA aspartic protease (TIGR02281 family)